MYECIHISLVFNLISIHNITVLKYLLQPHVLQGEIKQQSYLGIGCSTQFNEKLGNAEYIMFTRIQMYNTFESFHQMSKATKSTGSNISHHILSNYNLVGTIALKTIELMMHFSERHLIK